MKKILITGSTDGIGKLTAIQLAKEGHIIYLHGRTKEKLTQVIDEVKAASSQDQVFGFVADFSDLNKVKMMLEDIKNQLSGLDVLINNAGVFKTSQPRTKSGHDIRFVVNYFAPMMLANGLLPLLKERKDGRIINLSSAAQAEVSLEALSGNVLLSDQEAYAQSKLALTMWSIYLAKQEESIITIPVNPGSLLNTKMVKEAYGRHWNSADKGANILSALATNDEYLNKSGSYFDNDLGAFGKAHEDAYSTDKINILLNQTNAIIRACI